MDLGVRRSFGSKMSVVSCVFWTVIMALLSISEAGIMGDECDWTGSGLTMGESRGVTPVYVRCRAGRLTWLYPRGALRLLFRLPNNEQDFNLCVRVLRDEPDYAPPPEIFPDPEQFNTPPKPRRKFPARLFLEGSTRLLPLYAPDDGDEKDVRCFRVRRGKAALYVEAEPEEGHLGRRVAALRYEATPLPRDHYDPAAADCRPCSDTELSLAFCTSDLVSRGSIVGMEERPELDTTQLTLRVHKLLRHTAFTDAGSVPHDNYSRYDTLENEVDSPSKWRARRRARSTRLHAHVQVPARCGASHGHGQFLFMARRRLGRLTLVCAPRIDQWTELVDRMNADGSAHCELLH